VKSGVATSIFELADLETTAREALPSAIYEFVAAGAGNEVTLADNKAFDRMKLRKRVLRDVSPIDTRVDLFGQALSHPLITDKPEASLPP
jgi:4-hydroxymandelate oxidase